MSNFVENSSFVMKRLFLALGFLALAIIAVKADNPSIQHVNVLNANSPDSDKEDPFEENPYFLLVGEADAAIEQCDYLAAVLRLKEAISIEPENPSNALLFSNLGMVYNLLNQDKLALDAYDKSLEIAPSMTTVRNNRALLKLKMGLDDEAFADFGMVIEQDSLNTVARYYHGMLSLYDKELEAAENDFSVLKSVNPEGKTTNMAFATMYSMTGNEREAIRCYKKLIEDDPAPEFYSGLAASYIALDDFANASAIIAEGLERCGDDPELYYYRALLNKRNYLLDDAKNDAKKAVELGADKKRVDEIFK